MYIFLARIDNKRTYTPKRIFKNNKQEQLDKTTNLSGGVAVLLQNIDLGALDVLQEILCGQLESDIPF